MINKLINFLIIFLFSSIALVNSHLLELLGIKNFGNFFWVNGNYEFTKVIYFNIISAIILFLFFIKNIFKKNIFIPKIIFLIYILLLLSSIFSISPIISFFGNNDKSHSFLMFSNLIGIFIILLNSKEEFIKKLLSYINISLFFVIFIAIKEYFFPTFDYSNLSNRAIGTFGHPNYLVLYLLLFVPVFFQSKYIFAFKRKYINIFLKYLLIILMICTILITKSLLGIIILFGYLIYLILQNQKLNKEIILGILFLLFTIILYFLIKEFSYSKLDSLFSRFFIWDTTKNIIFNKPKTFFIGNGFETLDLVFDNFKSPYLYIFENFGFTADRPHNIFLNIFYHTGIFGVIIFIYLIYKLFKQKNSIYKTSLILGFLYLFLNYASITSYLIIVLIIVQILNKNIKQNKYKNLFITKSLTFIFIFGVTSFSIFGSYNSYNFYKSETLIYKGDYIDAINNYMFGKTIYKIETCEELLANGNKSIETYFYCGNIKYDKNRPQKSIRYFKLGLKKLPDLRNPQSKYFNNPIIKNNPQIIHRFFSPKYSNISKILEIVNNKKIQ